MMSSDEILKAIGGAPFLRKAIQEASNKTGIAISQGDIERIVAEVMKQLPAIMVKEVQQAAAANNMARTARQEFRRFCRSVGIVRPNNNSQPQYF